MSTTLTWANSGLGVATGTTIAAYIADLGTLVASKAGDAAFSWQVASVNSTTAPYYLALKRKSGAAGRILILGYTANPAGVNPILFDATPSLNASLVCFFPSGNVDTPTNLTSASGSVMGDDTGAVKPSGAGGVGAVYTSTFRPFYFDCADGIVMATQNPGGTGIYGGGAGNLVVDAADNDYPCTFSSSTSSLAAFSSTAPPIVWNPGALPAGGTTACIRTNYGSQNRIYFQAFGATGGWGVQPAGAADIMTDISTSKAFFCPVQLIGRTKGEGLVLKLRQIAWGPAASTAFAVYNTTGPVVAARHFCATTAGDAGPPWMTNFKI